MRAQDLIAIKRDGGTLDARALAALAAGLADGSMSDAQVAALAMAVLIRGMDTDERVGLTTAMRDSGRVLSWELPGPVIDKHSTGGIGDNVSLILAPVLAACGAFVPMVSGRGLGHTGGTLDKFDAIPGYRTQPDLDTFRRVVADVGCAIIGQTDDIAPADRRLYAVRDVTATVESIDLICASILSKKLAAGLDALVLDVKCGSGAFMATPADAMDLARALVDVANGAGCATNALLTDMNEPLAPVAGNALEMANAIACLQGTSTDPRLWEVIVALGSEALVLGGLASDLDAGSAAINDARLSGRAAERFGRMVAGLGGPANMMERPGAHLPEATVIREVMAKRSGHVVAIDARAVGVAVVGLGGGRRVATDQIDYAVGFDQLAGIGTAVGPRAPIARVHARREADADAAEAALHAAYQIDDTAVAERPLILERVV